MQIVGARNATREIFDEKPVLRVRQAVAAVQPAGLAGWVLGLWRGREAARSAKHLRVVETLALGGRKSLTLVVCDGQRFLVGGGSDSVATIIRVTNPFSEGE